MKHIYLALVAIFLVFSSKAQNVATFEDLNLSAGTFWNGSDLSGSFTSGSIKFNNSYNTEWQSWSGFACSSMKDATTAGFGNQYSAITGSGSNTSNTYAVAYPVPYAELEVPALKKNTGFYVTNSTYAYFSMKNGDSFSKKFGGESGEDPDFFKLTIESLDDNGKPTDTIDFFLADFRFTDHSKDYILDQWTWVDLSSLKEARKLRFSLSSSDNSFGFMNTPAYFCMDDLNFKDFTSSPSDKQLNLSVSPNPFDNYLVIRGITEQASVIISDMTGRRVLEAANISNNQMINGLDQLKPGVFIIEINDGTKRISTKLVKK